MHKNEIILVNENYLKDKIYTIRGVPVMLDYDLAYIYGYSTKRLNEQVKNNIDKFDEDFRFQLTREEVDNLRFRFTISRNQYNEGDLNLRSKNSTAKKNEKPKDFDIESQNASAIINPMNRSLPYAFTEQGLYMLMTVLKGELAIKQSKALIRLFKKMKDYILENNNLYELSLNNSKRIEYIENNMVHKNDIMPILELFNNNEYDELVFLNNDYFKADIIYQDIFSKAKNNIILIDDYIDNKVLWHLSYSKDNIDITIISDNKNKHPINKNDLKDFKNNYPNKNIKLIKSNHLIHDRYIIIDFNTKDTKIYHSGSSLKDTGKRISSLNIISDIEIYKPIIKSILKIK